MTMATVTKYEPSAWHLVNVDTLKAGDLIARIGSDGTPMQPRVVLHADGITSVLGYPKRMEATEDRVTKYATDDNRVVIVGHVEAPKPRAPKAPKVEEASDDGAATVAQLQALLDAFTKGTTPEPPKRASRTRKAPAAKAAPTPRGVDAGDLAEQVRRTAEHERHTVKAEAPPIDVKAEVRDALADAFLAVANALRS